MCIQNDLEKECTQALTQFLNETTKQSQQAHDLLKGSHLGLKNTISPLYGSSALFQAPSSGNSVKAPVSSFRPQ